MRRTSAAIGSAIFFLAAARRLDDPPQGGGRASGRTTPDAGHSSGCPRRRMRRSPLTVTSLTVHMRSSTTVPSMVM